MSSLDRIDTYGQRMIRTDGADATTASILSVLRHRIQLNDHPEAMVFRANVDGVTAAVR